MLDITSRARISELDGDDCLFRHSSQMDIDSANERGEMLQWCSRAKRRNHRCRGVNTNSIHLGKRQYMQPE